MTINTCKKVNQVLSSTKSLNLWEKMTLRWHMKICTTCQNVTAHFDFLRKAVSQRMDEQDQGSIPQLRELEDRVIKEIRKKE